jgi:hypothetical protein
MKPAKDATGVLVSGYDHIGQNSPRSIVGASWVFSTGRSRHARRVSGDPHERTARARRSRQARPARRAGWYGCSWIKWVNEIRLVGADEPATSQMVEFAARTHQSAPHKFAREYAPADIHTAATPVRVEKAQGPDGLDYRIVGIVWGGTKAVDRLQIRFGNDSRSRRSRSVQRRRRTRCGRCGNTLEAGRAGHLRHRTRSCRSVGAAARLKSGYYMRQVKRI